MALVTLKEVLKKAVPEKYAVGSFNAADHSVAEAILEVSENLGLPVILGVAEAHFRYVHLESFVPFLRKRIEGLRTPVVLHLDHGLSLDSIRRGLDVGFSSVMIDASSLPYEENASLTRQVVELAQKYGASVEAELGHVAGGEGDLTDGTEPDPNVYTDPEQASSFVEDTGVHALAVAIGTVHGPYKGTPHLDLDLLAEIRSKVEISLVLHGGSGLSKDDFQNAIAKGINKINFFTECSLEAVQAARAVLATGTPMSYPDLIATTKSRVREVVAKQIQIFGTRPLK